MKFTFGKIIHTNMNHTVSNFLYNTSNTTNSINGSGADLFDTGAKTPAVVLIIILSMILIACFAGNILLITAIIKIKSLRTESNFLIMNLAVSDMLTAMFSIPFTLVPYSLDYYPFGEVGCKLLSPLATYGSNASVFTLVCIALERYLAISSFSFRLTVKRIVVVVALVHIFALTSVVPYCYHLKHSLWKDGTPMCDETWKGTSEQKSYTIVLFALQYGLPLPVMIMLYSSAWWKIKQQNKKMIQMSEEYERKMAWEVQQGMAWEVQQGMQSIDGDNANKTSNDTIASEAIEENSTAHFEKHSETKNVKVNNDHMTSDRRGSAFVTSPRIQKIPLVKRNSLPVQSSPPQSKEIKGEGKENTKAGLVRGNSILSTFRRSDTLMKIERIKKRIKHFRKPAFISHTAMVRHKQTVRTLKMFTIVVAVFAIFALPNQITWLLSDFAAEDKQPPSAVLDLFMFLTYVNSVVNCWIYGGFNTGFRRAYKYIIHFVVTCGRSKNNPFHTRSRFNTESTATTAASYYDNKQQEQFSNRTATFTEMFEEHKNNFEHFRHLYHFDDEEEDEDSTLLPPPKPKRKLTLANILNALTPKSRANSRSSLSGQATPASARRKASQLNKRKYSLVPPIVPFTQAAGNSTVRRASTSAVEAMALNRKLFSPTREKSKHSPFEETDCVYTTNKRRRASTSAINYQTKTSTSETRKNSLWALFSPKFLHRKSARSHSEPEDPTILVDDDEDKIVQVAEIQVQEVKTVNVTTTKLYTVKTNEKPGAMSYNKMKQKFAKHSPNKSLFSPVKRSPNLVSYVVGDVIPRSRSSSFEETEGSIDTEQTARYRPESFMNMEVFEDHSLLSPRSRSSSCKSAKSSNEFETNKLNSPITFSKASAPSLIIVSSLCSSPEADKHKKICRSPRSRSSSCKSVKSSTKGLFNELEISKCKSSSMPFSKSSSLSLSIFNSPCSSPEASVPSLSIVNSPCSSPKLCYSNLNTSKQTSAIEIYNEGSYSIEMPCSTFFNENLQSIKYPSKQQCPALDVMHSISKQEEQMHEPSPQENKFPERETSELKTESQDVDNTSDSNIFSPVISRTAKLLRKISGNDDNYVSLERKRSLKALKENGIVSKRAGELEKVHSLDIQEENPKPYLNNIRNHRYSSTMDDSVSEGDRKSRKMPALAVPNIADLLRFKQEDEHNHENNNIINTSGTHSAPSTPYKTVVHGNQISKQSDRIMKQYNLSPPTSYNRRTSLTGHVLRRIASLSGDPLPV